MITKYLIKSVHIATSIIGSLCNEVVDILYLLSYDEDLIFVDGNLKRILVVFHIANSIDKSFNLTSLVICQNHY